MAASWFLPTEAIPMPTGLARVVIHIFAAGRYDSPAVANLGEAPQRRARTDD